MLYLFLLSLSKESKVFFSFLFSFLISFSFSIWTDSSVTRKCCAGRTHSYRLIFWNFLPVLRHASCIFSDHPPFVKSNYQSGCSVTKLEKQEKVDAEFRISKHYVLLFLYSFLCTPSLSINSYQGCAAGTAKLAFLLLKFPVLPKFNFRHLLDTFALYAGSEETVQESDK